jgi:hypothetical protein
MHNTSLPVHLLIHAECCTSQGVSIAKKRKFPASRTESLEKVAIYVPAYMRADKKKDIAPGGI